MTSLKVVTPVKTGVQDLCNKLKRLDSPINRKMTKNGNFRLFTSPSKLSQKTQIIFKKELDIIDAVFEHGYSFHTHPKGKT